MIKREIWDVGLYVRFDQDYPVTIITQKMACVMISGIRVRLGWFCNQCLCKQLLNLLLRIEN